MRSLVACALIALAVGCSLTLAPDSALTGGSASCHLDAGPAQDAGCWLWSAATAPDTTGWVVDNSRPDNSGSLDCCGCTLQCAACINNTAMSLQAGALTFSSGPEVNGGTQHKIDGFTARYAGVPVVPGRTHTLSLDIVNLDASLWCAATGTCSGTGSFRPTWSIIVYDGSTQLGTVGASWSTNTCTTCPGAAGDFGVQTVTFTPVADSVTVVVTATYRSASCEPWGVTLAMAWMSVVAQ